MSAVLSPELVTQTEPSRELIDGVFYIERQKWGTYVSYKADGTPLVTAMDEAGCESGTRFYLKGLQEGWDDTNAKTYDSNVGGKL